MNNIEELKSKKPENLKSRSSVLADYVTDDNTGGYFVIECGNCGEVFPSQKLDGGDAIADSGDYGDAYCPHCNETDPDECANVGLAWNVQQAKINALIAQLESVQKERDELRAEQKEHDGQIAEMEGKIQIRNTGLRLKTELYEKAKAALSAANEKPLTPVILEIANERRRQISVEGWAPEHDDQHSSGELAGAAGCYAKHVNARQWCFKNNPDDYQCEPEPSGWPWEPEWWKPKNPRSDLIRAAALIVAELERLDRAAGGKFEGE